MTSPSPRPLPVGPLAIDLLNTQWGANEPRPDWFDDDAAVRAFCNDYELAITDAEVADARRELAAARALIERLFHADGENGLDESIISEVNEALAHATASVRMTDDGPTLTTSSADATSAVAVEALVNAIELLRSQAKRIRSCEHDQCTLWFLDTSKAGRRRWCSMETCGNRAKASRHYKRAQSARDDAG